jgi:uncharacterized protein
MVPRVKTVLYLHGFASSPRGRKVALLREALEPEGYRIVSPDLNRPSFEKLDFEAMVTEAVRAARAEEPVVVVGSSLGALVALAAAREGVSAPLVLVAPALGFGSRWIAGLAPGDPVRFFHHGHGRELEVHRSFFEGMARLEVDREPPRQSVVVIMGERDESVPFKGVAATWRRWESTGRLAPGSRFVSIADGDHGLLGFADQIAEAIRSS